MECFRSTGYEFEFSVLLPVYLPGTKSLNHASGVEGGGGGDKGLPLSK